MPETKTTAERLLEYVERYGDSLGVTRDEIAEVCTENERLRSALASSRADTERLRGMVWKLADALGARCLADANAERPNPNDWPAGQEWDELSGSSQSTFRRIAYEAVGLDRASVVALLCDEHGNAKPYTDPPAVPSSDERTND